MTPSDPRVGEIEARLSAATPEPWKAQRGGDFQNIRLHSGSLWVDIIDGSGQIPPDGEWIDSPDIDFIESAPADVAYLLAQLRARDEALWRVERLAARWATLADGDRYYARHIRAALDDTP